MIDRRQFLGAAAAGAALTLIGAARTDHDASSDRRDLAHPELLVALGPDAVREIGRSYRALVPTEHDRLTLEAILRTELRAGRSTDKDPVQCDFAANRLIVVRGWMLSRTEARQCALFSLHSA